MFDSKTEIDKYALLIKKEFSIIGNTFIKLSDLYKLKNELLSKKRNLIEKEFLKENNKKITQKKENNKNNILNNFQDKKENETIISSKIIILPKFNEKEGKVINEFQINLIFGENQYCFGPYQSESFTNDLNEIIIKKLNKASYKWGNYKNLSQEQQNHLKNCFKEIEAAIENFFKDKDYNNNDINIKKENNLNEEKCSKDNLNENNESKKLILKINNITKKIEGENNSEKNCKHKIFNKNNQSFDTLNEETSEKRIKKEFNILNYLNEEDYEKEI